MKTFLLAVTGILVMAGSVAHAQDAAAVTAYSVVYVDVLPTAEAHAATVAALAAYRGALQAQSGFVALESFDQEGRAGHLVMIETWRDQAALESQGPVAQELLATALEPLRISNIDRRPYKALHTARGQAADGNAVYVISHVDAAPGSDIPAILQSLVEASRQESGNLRFDLLQHAVRGNHYTMIEVWRDRAALDAHVAAAHTRSFRDAFGPFAGSPLDERIFNAVK